MDAFVIVALVGIGLLIAELMLPTGGVLATLGVAGPDRRRGARRDSRLWLDRGGNPRRRR